MSSYLFTSESVTEGHPDKICDQVSDAILDEIIARDRDCRVACETFTKTGFVLIAGEITTSTYVDMAAIARRTIKEIGYDSSAKGFDYETCGVLTAIEQQSPDISRGVKGQDPDKQGAGDQGLMFGYACDETKELMPMPIQLAHKLAAQLAKVRKKKSGGVDFFRPDGKTQVSVRYEGGAPVAVEGLVVSTQHDAGATRKKVEEAVRELVIAPIVPKRLLSPKTKIHVNPTGRFVIGGPQGDSGLTGRKIIVDTYGGMARHGGGAFSGKDPSKVDRSASYYARYIAKHVVAAGLAKRCEVQLAYAIGVAKPVSMLVETYGTGAVSDEKLSRAVAKVFDARPGRIIRELELLQPIYRQTAAYGHFGRTGKGFTWEQTPKLDALRAAARAGNGVAVSARAGTASAAGKNGAAKNGAAKNGAAKNGAARGSSAKNGAARGGAKNGVAARNGVARNGAAARRERR